MPTDAALELLEHEVATEPAEDAHVRVGREDGRDLLGRGVVLQLEIAQEGTSAASRPMNAGVMNTPELAGKSCTTMGTSTASASVS